MKFIAEAEAASGEAGAVVVHDPALDDPSQAFQLSRLDTPEMSHVPMGIFRQVARPTYDDLVRDQVEAAVDHRRRPGDRRRPRRPAARTRHLDRRVTSAPPPATEGGGAPDPSADGELRKGTVYGFLAYGIWGLFPLYFAALKPAGAWEILGHRILWTLAVCALVLLVRRDLGWIRPFIARPRLVGGITIAALLIAANWTIYVLAVLTGRTYEAALGYFLNPIVTVALGVVVLSERLRPLQWAAVAIGALASVYLAVAGGVLPWISLSLAFSFGLYGLTKKKVGASLEAMHSLAAETTVLAPIAVVVLGILVARGETTFLDHGTGHTSLLVMAGVVTAVPLLLFAAAARRLPLVTVGLIQFVTPVLQLLVGVLVLGEHVSARLWVGFGIVWVALVLLSIDSLRTREQLAHRAPAGRRPTADGTEAPEPCP